MSDLAQAVAAERERCAKIAQDYAEENLRMAGDTILCDPFLHGKHTSEAAAKSEELMLDGAICSARYHAGRDIASLIRRPHDWDASDTHPPPLSRT